MLLILYSHWSGRLEAADRPVACQGSQGHGAAEGRSLLPRGPGAAVTDAGTDTEQTMLLELT